MHLFYDRFILMYHNISTLYFSLTKDGCEICKPAVGSILASIYNGQILDDGRDALQDTNDRSLANMQRGGTYSVVPRVPGGEITPEQLVRMGEVAKEYGLYTKVTGAQRIDLFGAAKYQLPDVRCRVSLCIRIAADVDEPLITLSYLFSSPFRSGKSWERSD